MCQWCHLYAHVEGYCRECFLHCIDEPPNPSDPPLMHVTHRAFVSLYNWNQHKMRQRRSDRLLRESAEMDLQFRLRF